MSDEQNSIMDTQIKGITGKVLWRAFGGWTTIIMAVLFSYYSLKAQIHDYYLEQAKTDAIQDMRLDGMKRDIELQNLQIKDLNERFNEMKSQRP